MVNNTYYIIIITTTTSLLAVILSFLFLPVLEENLWKIYVRKCSPVTQPAA